MKPRLLFGLCAMLFLCGRSAQGAGSPFYELDVVAQVGEEVAGVELTSTFIANIDHLVAGNDLGRVAFSAVLANDAGSQFWNCLVANVSPMGGLHRIQDLNDHPLAPPGPLLDHVHLNNSNRVIGTIFTGDTGNGELNGAIGYTFDIDITGGTFSNSTSSRTLVFDGRCAECVGEPADSNVCIDGHALTLDDAGNTLIVGIRSDNAMLCDYKESDPNFLYMNSSGAALEWQVIAPLINGTSGFGVPMAGAGPVTVLKQGTGDAEQIVRIKSSGDKEVLAKATDGWTELGRLPGISADGTAIVFAGSEEGDEPGIYLRLLHPQWPGATNVLVVGPDTVVGVDNHTNQIHFASLDVISNRICVVRQDVNGDGQVVEDRFIIAFLATPTSASLDNPTLPPGTPFFFSGEMGLWTMQVEVQRELAGTNQNIVVNPRALLPVLQVGDTVGGATVTDIRLWNGLGRATRNLDGSPRGTVDGMPAPSDHFIAFWVDTTAGPKVLRAAHLDDDEDGLPNHWERPGGGIDIDRDGIVDLALSDWGAAVDHKDLFLEVDWLKPRTSGVVGPWRAEPDYRIFQDLDDRLLMAPVPNPDGVDGIYVHIDAGTRVDPIDGTPYSLGVELGNLQGGDEISQRGTGASIDIVPMSTIPPLPPGVEARSLDDIKSVFFGSADKRARELAFRYCVFAYNIDLSTYADQSTFVGQVSSATRNRIVCATTLPPVTGNIVLITQGRGAGQVRETRRRLITNQTIRVFPDWTIVPDSSSLFVLLDATSGIAEADFRPDPNNHGRPGNDLIVSLGGWGRTAEGRHGSALFQRRTLLHELGHTLALRHGGTDHCAHKGDQYLSVMSYSHQVRTSTNQPVENRCVDPPVTVTNLPLVESLSVAGDPTFVDWDAIKLSPFENMNFLGNTHMLGVSGEHHEEMTFSDYLDLYDREPDTDPPVLRIVQPVAGSNLAVGATLHVLLDVQDESEIEWVRVAFDVNGDGSTNSPSQSVLATHIGGDLYEAEFPDVSGPHGPRTLSLQAQDVAGNITRSAPNILVGDGASGDQRAPTVSVSEPPFFGAKVIEEGSYILVRVFAEDYRDNFSPGVVDRVIVSLDLDGDGFTTGLGETRMAVQSQPGGTFDTIFPAVSGPLPTRVITAEAYDDWLNVAQSTRTITVVPYDETPPSLAILQPTPLQSFEIGNVVTVQVAAADAGGLDELTVIFDTNGDGTITSCDRVVQFLNGQTNVTRSIPFTMCFGGRISGPPGLREIVAHVTDRVGNSTGVVQVIEILPDSTSPSVSFRAPPPNSVVGLGLPFTVELDATDNNSVQQVVVSFDVNGDGVVSGATEQVTAVWHGGSTYRASFPALSGAPGPRTITAHATDPSSNTGTAQSVVQVVAGGVIVDPPEQAAVAPSSTFTVEIEIAPGLALSNVWVRLDLDGDGDSEGPGELVQAVPVGGRMLLASFSGLTGDPGLRTVTVSIVDTLLTTNVLTRQIHVLPPQHFEGLRSQHLGWVPNLPETLGTSSAASAPRDLVEIGPFLYFTANDGVASRELWRTDGTARGTRMVGQVAKEGSADELRSSVVRHLTGLDGHAYFRATDNAYGTFEYTPPRLIGAELWRTDGSPGHIELVRGADGTPNASPDSIVRFNNRLFYAAFEPATGRELRSMDGTAAGTEIFDLAPGSAGLSPEHLTVVGDRLFFAARNRTELWMSDGTLAGTSLVRDGFSLNAIRELIAVDHLLFFNANENVWVSDGTFDGTFLVREIRDSGVPFPQEFSAWNGVLYFSADDGVTGRELWRSDGTSNGTWQVRDLYPGPGGGFPTDLTIFDGALYFAANHIDLGREVWRSDGTTEGTQLAVDLALYTGDTPLGLTYPTRNANPEHFMVFQNALYFTADDGYGRVGRELYRSDGTQEGTALIRNLRPGTTNLTFNNVVPFSSSPQPLYATAQALYFSAETGYRRELWKTDGTAAGTMMLRNLFQAEPRPLHPFGAGLVISAADLAYGREPWILNGQDVHRLGDFYVGTLDANPVMFGVIDGDAILALRDGIWPLTFQPGFGLYRTDGTAAGTVKLHGFATLGHVVFPPQTLPDGRIVFRASEVNGEEPWVTDGTVAGTLQLADIRPGSLSSTPAYPATIGSEVYFSAITPTGWAIWRTDGSTNGTLQVADINPGSPDGASGRFTPMNGEILFAGYRNTLGRELWITDGTEAGTRLLREFAAGSSSGLEGSGAALLQPFHEYDGAVFFQAYDGNPPNPGLWKSDGTTNGTIKLSDRDPGGYGLDATLYEEFVEAGGLLFFAAFGQGVELHATDGTPEGTYQVRNIVGLDPTGSFEASAFPRDLRELNGQLIFTAFDYTRGRELWRSDGTLDATVPVKDILPGYVSSRISELTPLGSNLYFIANDDRHGSELWVTDGTADGTQLVEDLLPGPMSSNPSRLLVHEGRLYYYADAGGHDLSLRMLEPGVSDFDAWLDTAGLSGADRALLADPNGNKLPNLYDFLLGLDPAAPGPGVWIAAPSSAATTGANVWFDFSLVRREMAEALGLETIVEVSTNSFTWRRATAQEVGLVSLGDGMERVTLRVATPFAPTPYLLVRLRFAVP